MYTKRGPKLTYIICSRLLFINISVFRLVLVEYSVVFCISLFSSFFGVVRIVLKMGSEIIKSLAGRLFDIEAFKFGDFLLKSGMRSPVYFDLRVMISYPDVMVRINF